MKGKIYFDTLKELAQFLKELSGSTALFEVAKFEGQWVLTFLGGY